MGIFDFIQSMFSDETAKGRLDEADADDWDPQKEDSAQPYGDARISVTGKMQISGIGTVVTARITEGTLRKGSLLRFEDGETAEIETIELHHSEVREAEEGKVVGLKLSGIDASRLSEGDEATTETE